MDDSVNISGSNRRDTFTIEFLDRCSFTKDYIYLCFVVVGAVLVLVLLGNSLIVASVLKFPRMRRPAYILVANLSISNSLLVLNCVIGIIEPFTYLTSETRKYLCLTKLAVFLATFIGSEYNLLLISLERFFAILFPFCHKAMIVRARLWTAIAICWVLYISFVSLPFLGWNDFTDQSFCYMKDVWSVSYIAAICVTVFIGFICNIIFFLIVLYKLKCQRLQQQPRHNKTTWVSFCILFGFVICWCPFLILTFVTSVWEETLVSAPCTYVCVVLVGTTNGFINWLIYGLCNRRFRQAFKAIILCQTLTNVSLRRSMT